jgi:hypothetical protein
MSGKLKPCRLTVDQHPSLGLQVSIENDDFGFRIKGPKYAGTSRRLLTAELDARARQEIASYIGYDSLLDVARRLAALESDDGGRSFPTKEDIAAARAAIARATDDMAVRG